MEKQELFRIGEVARMFHISVGSLQHYEKLGLIHPEYTDSDSGYRYYGVQQFERLNTIRYLRALDMPLEDIADFLQNKDVGKIQEMLIQQRETVRQKQQELQIIEQKINTRLEGLADALSSRLDTITLIHTPPRRITWIRNHLSPKTYLDLETSIRTLQKDQEETLVFLGKVGLGISKEHLESEAYQVYDTVFLLLEPEDRYQGITEELPRQICVSIRFCGSHNEAPAYYQKLLAYIREHRLMIDGFSREVTMIDYVLTNDPKQFVTEIQIPFFISQVWLIKKSQT